MNQIADEISANINNWIAIGKAPLRGFEIRDGGNPPKKSITKELKKDRTNFRPTCFAPFGLSTVGKVLRIHPRLAKLWRRA